MGSKPWFKFWISGWKTPGVRMLSKPARADFLDLLCVMYQSQGGFCTTPVGKRMTKRQAIGLASIDESSMDEMLEAGVVELVDGCPYCGKVAEVLEDRDRVSEKRSEIGKRGAESRWQLPSGGLASDAGFATEKHGDVESREKREENRKNTISSVLESETHPARAHVEPGPRESDADFWGPKIEAVYQVIHGEQPQPDSRKAIAQALRTHRATDLVLAVEGARRNLWALEKASRRTLAGIVSPKRIDGHIQDARGFYGWENGAADNWASSMMRNHGGMR